ncbi:hypothetical protein SAMN04489742_1357 [Arthrobacter crystallopoietes]|uniref:Uncharacterized protein n=1 Tax=Crystallibacter crystallopoietes TaxID=37928 RepID=A0A1H1BD94_9MICC|nr:hypothetical protein SAMN04489742_1357 [Arthrobacter crystallopoietes]
MILPSVIIQSPPQTTNAPTTTQQAADGKGPIRYLKAVAQRESPQGITPEGFNLITSGF